MDEVDVEWMQVWFSKNCYTIRGKLSCWSCSGHVRTFWHVPERDLLRKRWLNWMIWLTEEVNVTINPWKYTKHETMLLHGIYSVTTVTIIALSGTHVWLMVCYTNTKGKLPVQVTKHPYRYHYIIYITLWRCYKIILYETCTSK